LIQVEAHQIRDYSTDKHHRVDDTPYGGGMGMLMAAPPIFSCFQDICKKHPYENRRVIYLSPRGQRLTQKHAKELAAYDQLILLCGHYEGVDYRVIETLVDMELSIGDYILTNGAIAAVVVIDAIARLLPGALGDDRSSVEESFSNGLLEAPAYTKPNVFRGMEVPAVFLSGNHKAIEEWKLEKSIERTKANRPDLYEAWAAAHPEYFAPKKRKKTKLTSYKPRKPQVDDTPSTKG
jgi:tRNA (guanine37-N1)-methyltransferase